MDAHTWLVFLNCKHLSWEEYSKKEAVARGYESYVWQVNHENGHPEHCILGEMSVVRKTENQKHYRANFKKFDGTVWKRPTQMKKRPGAILKRPGKR